MAMMSKPSLSRHNGWDKDRQFSGNFLAKNETTVVPQPSYSPDLAPADFFLFPKLKSTLKGRRFNTIDEIQKNSTNELFTIPKGAFQKAFQSWQKRWERFVASEGNYLEGDKLE